MKKISLLLSLTISVLLLFSCSTKNISSQEQQEIKKDDLSSLRKHLDYLGWIFLPLSETETLVSYHEWSNRATYKPKILRILRKYCKAQGGSFTISENSGKCIGGNDPFSFETIEGQEKYYRSTNSSYYFVFTIIKATKPDVDIDNGFYDQKLIQKAKTQTIEQFLKKNTGFIKPFQGLKKNDQEFSFLFSTSNPSPLKVLRGEDLDGFFNLIEFCKAHNGSVYKKDLFVYKPFNEWFVDFIKIGKGYTYLISPPKFYLEGTYVCDSPDQPFTFKVVGITISQSIGESALYKVFLSKGVPEDFEKNKNKKLPKSIENHKETSKLNSEEDIMALKASQYKTIIEKRNGPKISKAVYVYSENNCDYVAVIDKLMGEKTPNILNYKICNNQIVSKLPTKFIEPLPNFVKNILPEVINKAKLRKYTEYQDNYGYKVIAKAPREQDLCTIEVFVYHDNQLISYSTQNACQ